MHVSGALSVCLIPLAPCPQVHSLHLHLCSCPAVRSSCTSFLDSTHMPCCLAAPAAAKSLQSCPTRCDPIDCSPPGSCPWDSLGKNTGMGCRFLLQCMKVNGKSLSCVRRFATPWTAAHQAPPSIGFSRQEYWSGVPFPSPVHESEERK